MAKGKDDVSFGFVPGKKKKGEAAPAEPAEAPAEDAAADPFASTDSSADPFATPDSSADPFATPDASADASADPFATPDASADPFASTDSSADPFATPDASADPFASTDSSADPFATPDASADPFATPDASADPFATPDAPADASADPFATTETPAEAPAEEAAAPAEEKPAAPEKKTPKVKEHKQFRILIMGDFSGRANKEMMQTGEDVARRKVRTIDSDSFPKVMAALKPEIQLPVSETSAVPLTFSTIEDFRPDALVVQIEAFAGMLKLREELKNPKTFKAAAAAVRKLTGEKKPAKAAGGKAAPRGAESGSEFERMLSKPVAPKNAENATADSLIANLVAGYEVPDADPDQARLVKLIEDALSAGLRAVLRHPAFQAVETSWRGVEFLTSRLNTDADLKICVFDISKDELYADLHTPASVDKSGIYRTIVEETKIPGVEPFALVVGNFMFDQTPRDISMLAKIASLMHLAGIPFLAAATAKVAGFPSFGKFPDAGRWTPPPDIAMWEKIRTHKAAAHIGLAAPRFLIRMPYGPKTDAIDAFPFEEMPGNVGGAGVDGYLWENGAFAVALCMGEAFLEDGWSFQPATDVTDLPCHMAMVDGDREMTPCAEGWLSDRVAAVLHDLGLIPLLSVRNAASVKVAGVHSIAKGGKPLAASWTKA